MSTSKPVTLSAFEKKVKEALKFFNRPTALTQKSPLASPYFLGRAAQQNRSLGDTLCAEIHAAACTLWDDVPPSSEAEMRQAIINERTSPESDRYAFLVLELRCFHTFIKPRRTSDIYEQPHLLLGSKSQHYRDFDIAVQKLAIRLLERLRPRLMLEQPLPTTELFGYDTQIAQVQSALQAGKTVMLSGGGGVGKSTLGAHVVMLLPEFPAFWFTLRPTLNDNLSSLLFMLAYFLHERHASGLWQYLITLRNAAIESAFAIALLQNDLRSLPQPPLLCFDELEYLYSPDIDHLPPARVQVLELLEALQGACPILLISQRPVLQGDFQLHLSGLAAPDIDRMWRNAGLLLSASELEQLFSFTSGNPRLLVLCRILQQNGEAVADIVSESTHVLSLLPIFNRLWRRLAIDERKLLQQLSVFRSYAPADTWNQLTLTDLVEQQLIVRNGIGGVALLPALREIVHMQISAERREVLHQQAATIRMDLAEYTAAAYHYWQGRQATKAVQCWYPHRHLEINHGQAAAALEIFNALSGHSVGKSERKALTIIRAELSQLIGAYESGLKDLESSDWHDDSELTLRQTSLRGKFQETLGHPDAALQTFGEGIRVAMRLQAQLVHFRYLRADTYLGQREFREAEAEANKATYDLAILQGLLSEEKADYAEAEKYYQEAHELALALDDDLALADAERQLASLAGRGADVSKAIAHAQNAIEIYERIGARVNLEKAQSNLAFVYVQAKQFHAAIDVATPAYRFFVAAQDPYYAAVTAANLAEAHSELGQLAEAEEYANAIIQAEERWAYPYAHFTLGQVHRQRDDLLRADAHFRQALQTAKLNEDVFMVAYANRMLGSTQHLLGNHESALIHVQDALKQFTQMGLEQEAVETRELLQTFADM